MRVPLLIASVYLILVSALHSCSDPGVQLKSEGYQVFSKSQVALKCPCELQLDTADMNANIGEYHDYTSYICEVASEDSSKKIYHLQFLMHAENQSENLIEESVQGVKKMLVDQGIDSEEREIASMRSLHYAYSPIAQGVEIYHENFNCYIIVESNDPKHIEEIISTVQLY
jgi:hypothetical protein